MSDFYIGDLTPGTFVVNVSKKKNGELAKYNHVLIISLQLILKMLEKKLLTLEKLN